MTEVWRNCHGIWFWTIRSGCHLPIYTATKETLGRDKLRWLPPLGQNIPTKIICDWLWHLHHVQFHQCKNEFLGGSIHPGWKMRHDDTHRFTGKLLFNSLGKQGRFNRKRYKTNMLTGVLYAAGKEIDGIIDEYLVKFPWNEYNNYRRRYDLLVYTGLKWDICNSQFYFDWAQSYLGI